jgi:hypothetical protein
MIQALLLRIMCRALNLVIVVVQSDDIAAAELDHLARRATHTAPDVQHAHVVAQAHDVGEVVLVAGNGLREGLAVCEAAEMERLAPAVLVQVGGEVVVARGY